jgi:hypothetical protein
MYVSSSQRTLERDLLADWNRNIADIPHTYEGLGTYTGEEVQSLIRQKRDQGAQDALLLALIALEHAGDKVAGQAIVKSFLPLAFRLARTSAATRDIFRVSTTDATATTISVLWEVIHTYKVEEWTHSVAGYIRGQMLHVLETSFNTPKDVEKVSVDEQTFNEIVEVPSLEDEPMAVFKDLVTILTWAVDSGTLRRDEIEILVRIELAVDSPSNARDNLAEELGTSRESLNRRLHRIRTKLMNAVSGDLSSKLTYASRRS